MRRRLRKLAACVILAPLVLLALIAWSENKWVDWALEVVDAD